MTTGGQQDTLLSSHQIRTHNSSLLALFLVFFKKILFVCLCSVFVSYVHAGILEARRRCWELWIWNHRQIKTV